MAKTAKSQFQYFFEYFWIFATVLDEMFGLLCVAFNRGHIFETLRSLMSWDGKTHKNQELDFLEYTLNLVTHT